MASSRVFLLCGLVFAMLLVVSSYKASARELVEATNSSQSMQEYGHGSLAKGYGSKAHVHHDDDEDHDHDHDDDDDDDDDGDNDEDDDDDDNDDDDHHHHHHYHGHDHEQSGHGSHCGHGKKNCHDVQEKEEIRRAGNN